MIDYNYYLKINNNYSGIIDKHDMISEIQDTMGDGIDNNFIDQFEVKIGMDRFREKLLINFEKEIYGILKFKQMKEAVYNSSAREMLTEVGAVNTGDYVKHIDKYDPEDIRVYIVRNYVDRRHGRYDSTFILRCHRQLKWVGDNGVIHWYPVHFVDNKTMMMESNSKLITMPADIQQCFIQENEYTKQIDNGWRFVSNGRVFEVIGTDEQTMNGLITLRLRRTVFTDSDNRELEIADYYKYFDRDDGHSGSGGNEDIHKPDEDGKYSISINGDSDMFMGFDDIYSADVRLDGESVQGVEVDWSLKSENEGDVYMSIQATDGYDCGIDTLDDMRGIGKSATLKVWIASDETIFAEKEITIRGLF